MNIYNIRIDKSNIQELTRRLMDDSTICMGWGGGESFNLDLGDEDNLWHRFKNAYNISNRRINSICKIRQFKNNDILVIPHLPQYGKFIVGIVDGDFKTCYSYDQNDAYHLNHRITLKRMYGINGSLDIHNNSVHDWYAKLGWMRLPVYPLFRYKDIFENLLKLLKEDKEKLLAESYIGDLFKELRADTSKLIADKLQKLSPSNSAISFEKICQELISSYGYKYIRSNHHKGGGHADLIFEMTEDTGSPFETVKSLLYVQVKKHSGETDAKAIDQLLRIMEEDTVSGISQGCALTLGSFSEEACELADEHNIVLIEGEALIDLFMEKLI